jgi:hypothetical protein
MSGGLRLLDFFGRSCLLPPPHSFALSGTACVVHGGQHSCWRHSCERRSCCQHSCPRHPSNCHSCWQADIVTTGAVARVRFIVVAVVVRGIVIFIARICVVVIIVGARQQCWNAVVVIVIVVIVVDVVAVADVVGVILVFILVFITAGDSVALVFIIFVITGDVVVHSCDRRRTGSLARVIVAVVVCGITVLIMKIILISGCVRDLGSVPPSK